MLLGSNLSGTFNAAQAAIRAGGLQGVHLVDSRSGLPGCRASGSAGGGVGRLRLEWGAKSPRSSDGFSRTPVCFLRWTRMTICCGQAEFPGARRGWPGCWTSSRSSPLVPMVRWFRSSGSGVGRMSRRRVLALLEQRLTPRPKVVRFGVAHADAPEAAQRIRAALIERSTNPGMLGKSGHGRTRHPRGTRSLGHLLSDRRRCTTPKRGPKTE